jgi:hypothetical protein
MDILSIKITQITLFISILILVLCAAYHYIRAKKRPTLKTWESNYLANSKKYEKYMNITNRNLNAGLILSGVFMLLSILANLIDNIS